MSVNKLYFAQHGLAIDKTDNPERPLSTAGIEQTEAIARHLQRSAIPISQIFHSGKLRALQTAEIIASVCNIKSVSAIDYLSPDADVTLIAENLTFNNALYIGHLPHLEKLITYLVTSRQNEAIIKFHNSGIACLEYENKHYHLKWYVSPDELS